MATLQPFSIHVVFLLSLLVPSTGEQEEPNFESLITHALEARREGRLEEATVSCRPTAAGVPWKSPFGRGTPKRCRGCSASWPIEAERARG